MNARNATVLLVCCSLVAAIFGAATSTPSAASSISPTRASIWEYKSITLDSKGQLGNEARDLGRQGWELVDVASITEDSCTTHVICYFKRFR